MHQNADWRAIYNFYAFIRISVTFFFVAVLIIDIIIILTPFKIFKMNTRFNFLVQFALVAVIFGFSSFDSYSQFAGQVTKPPRAGGGGGNEDPCFNLNEVVWASLLLSFDEIESASVALQEVQCDLFVGLTSYNSSTTFVALDEASQINFSETTVELKGKNLSSNEYLGDIISDEQSSQTGIIVNAVSLGIEIQLPKILESEICEQPQESEEYPFVLNLYCKVGDDFVEVNPCDMPELFFLDNLLSCSLEQEVVIELCCVDNTGFSVWEDQENQFFQGELPQVIFNESSVNIFTKNINKQDGNFKIISLEGLIVKEGKIHLNPYDSHFVDLNSLTNGIYLWVYVNEFGQSITKKILLF